MRRLIIVRHAKSSWAEPALADFDRPLNARGERDAPVMARRLWAWAAPPDVIWASPAARTRATVAFLLEGLEAPEAAGGPAPTVAWDPELYLATDDDIVDGLARFAADVRSVLVCGHNPGLTDLVNRLGDARLDNLPTAGVAVIDFARTGGAARGRLVALDTPKHGFLREPSAPDATD